jgi:hypothetical protein
MLSTPENLKRVPLAVRQRMASGGYYLLERAMVRAVKMLPLKFGLKTRLGDYLAALKDFVDRHDRLPRRTNLINDRLFEMMTTSEGLNPLRAFVTDKEYLKLFVSAVVGHEHNVPTIAVLRTPEEARTFPYPNRCIIKPTHLSGTVFKRTAGEAIPFNLIENWFAQNWYYRKEGWEVNYKYLKAKVIVEPFVFDDDNPNDYKVFCFGGRPKLIQVDIDRDALHRRAFFESSWVRQNYSMKCPVYKGEITPPANLSDMLDVAARLSSYFSFIRVDLYSDGNAVYVGELTNCPEAALGVFVPSEAEEIASETIFGSC